MILNPKLLKHSRQGSQPELRPKGRSRPGRHAAPSQATHPRAQPHTWPASAHAPPPPLPGQPAAPCVPRPPTQRACGGATRAPLSSARCAGWAAKHSLASKCACCGGVGAPGGRSGSGRFWHSWWLGLDTATDADAAPQADGPLTPLAGLPPLPPPASRAASRMLRRLGSWNSRPDTFRTFPSAGSSRRGPGRPRRSALLGDAEEMGPVSNAPAAASPPSTLYACAIVGVASAVAAAAAAAVPFGRCST
eukprot:360298-Chlamydomonas_euryale.AAC.2